MSDLTISLNIAERPYKLIIAQEHESLFRQAAELIAKRMREYSGSYAYKDMQDLLAMVALEYATNYIQDERMLSGKESDHELQLARIDKLLSEYLEK